MEAERKYEREETKSVCQGQCKQTVAAQHVSNQATVRQRSREADSKQRSREADFAMAQQKEETAGVREAPVVVGVAEVVHVLGVRRRLLLLPLHARRPRRALVAVHRQRLRPRVVNAQVCPPPVISAA
eukprot:1069982-Rhodomonas_salina.1